MNEQQKEETHRLYEEIIQEVVKKLKYQSDRGQLQMSESEIMIFKDIWLEYLQELRKPQQQQKINRSQESQLNEQPIGAKEQTEEIQDQVQKKVKKGNVNSNNDQVEESQIKQDDNDSDKKDLSLADEESDEEEQQEKIEQVSKIEKEAEEILKQERYEQKKYERDREKTLFDKYKELLNIEEQKKSEIKREQLEEQNGDDDNQFLSEIQIYAQKHNTDASTVSRIRPNRQQRINLEYVLIKNKNEEIFLHSSQLSFIFKTTR